MRYIIVEDERHALQHINNLIKTLRPSWTPVFLGGSVKETVNFLNKEKQPDLCFFDVELNDGDCFEILRNTDINCPIIFTTGYDDYILKAYKVNSVDYLLKPIFKADLEAAIIKFEKYYFEDVDRIDTLEDCVSDKEEKLEKWDADYAS